MNATKHKVQPEEVDKILPLYDFADGIRGKHAQAYQQGYRVLIHKRNGTTELQEVTLPEGTVMLDPDVLRYFPDAVSVNRALRGLIGLIPESHRHNETAS